MQEIINTGAVLLVTEGVKEFVKVLTGTFIKPKLEKIYKNTELEKDLDKIEYYIKDYLERSYEEAEIMNTIVFKNQQKRINDLYIPLTLVKSNMIYEGKTEEIYVNKYKEELLNKYKKVLLVDSAGMGKSTILKYLYLTTIRENKGIPVLIELRKLEKNKSIIEYILKEMNGLNEYFNQENIKSLIEGGDFIFFFDGYDEIAQESKGDITFNLQNFISKCSNNLFVMSSRDENELNCFGDFQRFDIKSLDINEAYKLIEKYDNYGELSKELIEKLKIEENLKIINEFLENPLMVSLLYKAFEYKKTIPYKKHIFYRQVYDALFEEHDLSKPGAFKRIKESNLDIEDFHAILRTIGFITLSKGIIYSREEFVKIIKQAKEKNSEIKFSENKFINDIINAIPIFKKDGNEYRWAHKSFQEYFAANYIYSDCKNSNESILKKLMLKENISKYYNVLDFYYDIDYKGFKRYILYPIAKDYTDYYENTYTDYKYNNYEDYYIEARKLIQYKYSDIKVKIIDEEEYELCNGEVMEYARKLSKDIDVNRIDRITVLNDEIVTFYKINYTFELIKLLKPINLDEAYKISQLFGESIEDIFFKNQVPEWK